MEGAGTWPGRKAGLACSAEGGEVAEAPRTLCPCQLLPARFPGAAAAGCSLPRA